MRLNGKLHASFAFIFGIVHFALVAVTVLQVWDLSLELVTIVYIALTILVGILVGLWSRWTRFFLLLRSALWWDGVLSLLVMHSVVVYRALCPHPQTINIVCIIGWAITSWLHSSFLLGIDMVLCSLLIKALVSLLGIAFVVFLSAMLCGISTFHKLHPYRFLNDLPAPCGSAIPSGVLPTVWLVCATHVSGILLFNIVQFLRCWWQERHNKNKTGIRLSNKKSFKQPQQGNPNQTDYLAGNPFDAPKDVFQQYEGYETYDAYPMAEGGSVGQSEGWGSHASQRTMHTEASLSGVVRPFPLEVNSSSLHGRGVFAQREFYPGEIVEVCPYIEVANNDVQGLLADYVFDGHNEGTQVLLFGYGSLYNSAPDPNVESRHEDGQFYFVARKYIGEGDEILHDYGETWFVDRGYPYRTYDSISVTPSNI
eukprot:TRINITY_DN41954_c0_g1_i1.p1 TRINITY_DN41954_c0_g1~~TRINITY_DN41954_c0_g1_i1.p1  ORF type:complete len:425 (+),score=9.00 TRINITY_DN41954_c0_g1_i1:88-1362(+)